ncbi:MAG: RNA polymerase sigma factor [Gemmatimonadota bacterium]|nr:MAG: RNA polymerase sigma factor [Gemmatimonadota bacterium]
MSEPTRIDESIAALVRRAQAGEEAAFETLVRRHYEQVHRWALARTGDRDDADDVTQEVLVRLHRHIGGFDGRSQFTTWLYQVTRSAAADLHRKRARRDRLALKLNRESGPAAHDPRGEADAADERRAAGLVRTFLEELSERQREVFDLCDLQGLGAVEVSAMLKMEPVTVRSHLFRARKAIRRKILENCPELVEGYGD